MSDNKKEIKSEKENKLNSNNDLEVKLPPEILNISQKVSIEDMEKLFPHLHAEISDDKMTIEIDSVEGDFAPSKEDDDFLTSSDPYSDFEPSVIDYIRRAKTEEEALEVIEFSLKQGTLDEDEALKLTGQIRKDGVRSFGSIRTPGHYFRKAAEIRNRRLIQRRYSVPKKE
jgi:hypothetical protein